MKIIRLLLVSIGLIGAAGCETVPKADAAREVERILAENPEAWLEIKQVDAPPQVRDLSPAQYPFELKRAGITGSVVVQFDITKNGTPTNFQIMRSDHELFSLSVLAAAKRWTFHPAKVNRKSVNVRRVQMPVKFDIN